jgi:hypothetical protein
MSTGIYVITGIALFVSVCILIWSCNDSAEEYRGTLRFLTALLFSVAVGVFFYGLGFEHGSTEAKATNAKVYGDL